MGITHAQYVQMLTRSMKRDDKPALGPGPDRESDLHDQIMDYCRGRGWLAVHSRMDKRTTQQKGVSDFIIITPVRVFFVECKRVGQKLTPDQLAFAAQIKKLGWPHAVVHNMAEFVQAITA